MKLAIVADELDPSNGWGRYAGELARGLIAAGVDVRLVTPGAAMPGDLRAHADHAAIPSFRRSTPHFARLLARSVRPLWRALRGVDAVHCMVEPYAPPLLSLPAAGRSLSRSSAPMRCRPAATGWSRACFARPCAARGV